MYVEGIGLEDFKECKRTFCHSNELASVTRLSRLFHQHQHIDEHFFSPQPWQACIFWWVVVSHNGDGVLIFFSGNFIYQNYCQALEQIKIDTLQLTVLSTKLGISSEEYKKYLDLEHAYQVALQTEPEDVKSTADYMEHIHEAELKEVF